MASEPLKDAIIANALGPKRAQDDAGSVEQHSPRDQIEVDRYDRSTKVAKDPLAAVRRYKAIPPGTA